MARKSSDRLTEELSQCARDLLEVSRDPEWSGQNDILIRKAIPVFFRKVAEAARWVVVIRFHVEHFPYTGPRRALNFRDPSVLLRARWNDSEALLVLADDPEGFLGRIRPILANEGLTASLGYTSYSGSITHDYDRAAVNITERSLQ